MTTGASATALEPGGGRKFSIGADEVLLKGRTEHEGDGFSVVEYHGAVQPGPPMHVHHTFDECWVILEGEIEFRPARYVALIEELGALIPKDGPPDENAIVVLFKRYDTDIVG